MTRPCLATVWRARVLTLICLAACSAACAPKLAPPPAPAEARLAYALFRRNYCAPQTPAAAVLVKASFTYTSPGPHSRTNRTVLQLFGNLDAPLRLDVRTGIGTVLVFIRESRDGILAFYPDRETAYQAADPVLGAQRLGLPFPFSLRDLAVLLAGDFSRLTPETFAAATPLPGGGFRFAFPPGRVRELVLDARARPASLSGALDPTLDSEPQDVSPGPWTIAFSDYAATGPAPQAQTLTLFLPMEEKGVLRIKSRELKVNPWPAASLDLPLPPGSAICDLNRSRAPKAFEMDGKNGVEP